MIKHKSNMVYDAAYLAKLESGKEPLPTGVVKSSGGKGGYRIIKTYKNKDYRFGTFQNLSHALRTNEFINRLLSDIKEEMSKRGATVDDVDTIVSRETEELKLRLEKLEQPFWKRIFSK